MITRPVIARVTAAVGRDIDAPSPRGGQFLGPEKIMDGGFDSGVVWTPGAGWTIEDSAAFRIADVMSSGVSQPVAFNPGRLHIVTFTVAGYVAGFFAPQFLGGTTRNGTSRMANGTYTETLLANTGNITFRIFAGSTTVGNVDSVSVREIL